MKKKLLIIVGASQIVFSQTGNVGINTTSPTNNLDVNGNTRIRKIEEISSTNYLLVPNKDGVINKISVDNMTSSAFMPRVVGLVRRTTNFSYNDAGSSNEITLLPLDEVVVLNNQSLTYANNGIFTVKESGLYQITFQLGLNDFPLDTDIIMGIVNGNRQWIGRATFSYPKSSRQFHNYVTTLKFNAGDSFAMGIYSSGGNMTIQGNQSGSTGSGNITNVNIIRYQ
ncbi:hypothetical protein AAEU33_17355 [Chryseobacterium sp. Chry.R1]|uniref:hypothetical protein n=1 Tax=Chryseobacterium sp. Chry.R1 TaxID=3139392 RepID=UPI0031F81F71